MSLLKPMCFFAALSVLLYGSAFGAETGVMLKASEMKAAPYSDAKTVRDVPRGEEVELLRREGGWYEVKTSQGQGWVRMLSVRRGAARKEKVDLQEILELASGRAGTGQIVATTGIRGLNEEELKKATYNEKEVGKLESFRVTRRASRRFAAEAPLVARKLSHLPEPD